ncbi:MAG: aminotransferase class V-fold PLP-dependent enzyme [Bryobacterales bacterium]|nr:aminotransferase class V-fold PLP-dependent enzyme [Bryobacterales bacterium]
MWSGSGIRPILATNRPSHIHPRSPVRTVYAPIERSSPQVLPSPKVDPLLSFRSCFPTLRDSLFFISHSLGAMPAAAAGSLAAYAATWQQRSIRAWEEGWWQMPLDTANLLAPILGAAPGSIVMQPNVTVAQWIVLSAFDWRGRRNKLLTESANFPTNLYTFHELERLGARLVEAPAEEQLLDAIDEETQLVCVSHVHFRDSYKIDLAPIVEKAHANGAMVLADVYQSAGCVPIDVTALNLDFAAGGSVKWLCGGPGAGFLYVRPDLIGTLRPQLTGWMAHRSPFAFEEGPIEYADSIYRFLHGTPSIPALYAARSGYELIAQAGVENIRAKSIALTNLLIELAGEYSIPVRSPNNPEKRGGVVVLGVLDITGQLARHNVLVDYRPGAGIRVGPHFYNTEDEVVELVRRINALIS